jgi:Translationally controlled tumour protein.
MKYQALRATGKVNVAKSNTQIIVAAVEPLSYMVVLLSSLKFDIESIERGAAILAKAIVKVIPNVKISNITIKSVTYNADGNAYFVVSDGTGTFPGTTAVGDQQIDITAVSDLVDAINSGNKEIQDYINDYIKKINNKISAVTNPDVDNVMAKANNFLNKVIAKFVNLTGDKFFMNCVTPIVLFEGNEGIDRLQPGMTVEVLNNRMTAILTSPTEEYLVPAMYKYIAVRQGDKIVDSKVLSGQDKVIALNLKEGECEIIYQTCRLFWLCSNQELSCNC